MKLLHILLLAGIAVGSGIQKPKKEKEKAIDSINFPNPNSLIKETRQLLKEGDLILRLNRDPLSRFIKNFNRRDKKYSHAGLLFFQGEEPFVYHIVNGSDSTREFIVKDSFADFCSPKENLSFGVFRFAITSNEIKELKKVIKGWQAKKIRFDHQFNPDTDQKMYCSEMISKALRLATCKRINTGSTLLTDKEALFLSTHLHLSNNTFMKKGLVAIDNLYQPSFSRPVKECQYRN